MGDILRLLDTPLPTILVIGGIVFVFLGVVGQFVGQIQVPRERQKLAGGIGVALLLCGIALHVLSAAMPPLSSSPANPQADAPPIAPAVSGAPAAEPLTLTVEEGTHRVEVTASQPIIATWAWLACDPQLLQNSLAALAFQVTVDGQLAAAGDLADYRSEPQAELLEERSVWVVYYSYSMGPFAAGSSHWLEIEWQLSQTVTDGCDMDGDGNLDLYEPGSLGTDRLEMTVQ